MTENRVHVGLLSQIRPTVNFANRLAASPGQQWGPRKIPDCQLIYIVAGSAELTLGGQKMNLSAGDCIFYGSNSPHRIVCSEIEGCSFTSIHFSWHSESNEAVDPIEHIVECEEAELSTLPQSYVIEVDGHEEITFPHHFVLPNLESFFMQIVREYRFAEKGFSAVLRGLLTQLLVHIIRHFANRFYSTELWRKMAPALEAIWKQPNYSWTTPELAALCGYHPTYMAEIFRKTTGHSPKHYLILERIRRAKHYLVEAHTVEEVAVQLGYSSVHYFCRNFKAITGQTPSEFRSQSIEL